MPKSYNISEKNILIFLIIIGIYVALHYGMSDKNYDKIESQTKLSKSLLVGCISVTTGIMAASEILFGIIRQIFTQYRIPLYFGFCSLFVSYLCFFVSYVIRDGITSPTNTENIEQYLFRKKSLYNKIGIIIYLFSLLYFFVLISITFFQIHK